MAYEWLVKVDPSAADRLIPGMLLDPAPDFRRDAVALKIDEAAKVDPKPDKEKAVRLYREALSGRDSRRPGEDVSPRRWQNWGRR